MYRENEFLDARRRALEEQFFHLENQRLVESLREIQTRRVKGGLVGGVWNYERLDSGEPLSVGDRRRDGCSLAAGTATGGGLGCW